MRNLLRGATIFALLLASARARAAQGAMPPSGTPQGTAAIAAKVGFMEVAGIKLGMPVKDAVKELKNMIGPPEILTTAIVPPFTAPADAPKGNEQITASAKDGKGDSETIELLSTLSPNAELVRSIKQKLDFSNGSGPNFDSVLADLRKKYGPESLVMAQASTTEINTLLLRWYFDPDGHSLQGSAAQKEWSCTERGDNGGPACSTLTVLEILIQADGIKQVYALTEQAQSYPLDRSAEDATQAAASK
jgi:hypothetical protein